ncbi:MAG: nucleotidyltransferase domain-containing protein [Phycisphaerales bacterium]|nr:nucleotidyltransferase domain-containing protein [Phycisphaerales bacterium]
MANPHSDIPQLVTSRLGIDLGLLAELAREFGVRRLSFFGSILRDDWGDSSDVDMLAEFESGEGDDFVCMELADRLAKLTGREVQVLTPGTVHPYYRDEILGAARSVYVAA